MSGFDDALTLLRNWIPLLMSSLLEREREREILGNVEVDDAGFVWSPIFLTYSLSLSFSCEQYGWRWFILRICKTLRPGTLSLVWRLGNWMQVKDLCGTSLNAYKLSAKRWKRKSLISRLMKMEIVLVVGKLVFCVQLIPSI
jgi:hypothetical protein